MNPSSLRLEQVPVMLRGEADRLIDWTRENDLARAAFFVFVIVVGSGIYGATIGMWRAGEQAFYAAVKFPLVILLTVFGNAALNGMLAPLLGLNLRFRESLFAVLVSFTITSAILAGFSPILFFLVMNTPSVAEAGGRSGNVHAFVLLLQVVVIAFAGVAGNLRLMQFLKNWSSDAAVARRVMLSWLAGNLFFGAQLSWNLRPFIGSPGLPVQFLRDDALSGTFYEAVFNSVLRLISS